MNNRILLLLPALALVVAATSLHAQTIDSAVGYFPLQIGNYWVYHFHNSRDPSRTMEPTDTLTVLGDTTTADGHHYWTISFSYDRLWPYTQYERVDSTTGALLGFDSHKQAEFDFQWSITAERNAAVFGVPTDMRRYANPDALWYAWLANGIGVTYANTRESIPLTSPYYELTLLYAKINGRELGTKSGVETAGQSPNALAFNAAVQAGQGIEFHFTLPAPEHARITLIDMSGREIPVLDADMSAGEHRSTTTSIGLPAGAYLAVLRTSSGTIVQRVEP